MHSKHRAHPSHNIFVNIALQYYSRAENALTSRVNGRLGRDTQRRDAGADVSNATAMDSGMEIKELLVGKGKVKFNAVTWEEAPLSYLAMNGLTTFPILEYKGAIMTRGSSQLNIHKQRVLK